MKSISDPQVRREPKQQRSKHSVNTMLDAVTVVLKRYGPDGVTTNRISAVAGFSIGSLYQYFPDKQAIYRALHERHVDEVRAAITHALAEKTSGSLEDFTRALVEGLVNVHAADPQLHQLITALVPEGPAEFRSALREIFEQVVVPVDDETKRMLFVLSGLIESLVHGLAEWPSHIPLEETKAETVKTALAYLETCRAQRTL
jgi:AcrR family transcriptional regulator